MDNIVPSPIVALAQAVRHLLSAEDTPIKLRARLVNFVSELRDMLPGDAGRHLDGLEAEAIIASFAAPDAPAPLLKSLVERHLSLHQTPDARQSKSEDTSG